MAQILFLGYRKPDESFMIKTQGNEGDPAAACNRIIIVSLNSFAFDATPLPEKTKSL